MFSECCTWEQEQLVKEVDLGRNQCCQVYVQDTETGESATVVTETVGPIRNPS